MALDDATVTRGRAGPGWRGGDSSRTGPGDYYNARTQAVDSKSASSGLPPDADGQVFRNNWAQVQNPASKDVWYNILPEAYLDLKPASSYALPSNRLAFYERNSFFHCPSARFPKPAHDVGYQMALFSVAMNSQLINPPDRSILFSRVKNTAQTVLFLDNLLEDEKPVVPQQAQDQLGQPSAYANRFAGRRHGRSGNLGFADGHADTLLGEKVVETHGLRAGWAITPPVEVLWEGE